MTRFEEAARACVTASVSVGRRKHMARQVRRFGTASLLSVSTLLLLPGTTSAQYFDELNGVWTASLNGKPTATRALTESYPPLGVRLTFQDRVVPVTKDGDTLTSDASVSLRVTGLNTPARDDDTIRGTFFEQQLVLRRDVTPKAPIVVELPGDRPWVRFMQEVLIPKSAEDRDTYHTFQAAEAGQFLRSCQLYRSGYWQTKYMQGATKAQQDQSFSSVITGTNGASLTPRTILLTRFNTALVNKLNAKAKSEKALALSSLGMYFSTAAGGALRIRVTPDSTVYYITDRRQNDKLGLVVMATPAHPPLASSFGKWLLDFGAMPKADDAAFARALLETMAESSTKAAASLSAVGKSAFTDYLGVMAIEDQRGVMFNNQSLRWGYNMTSASFCALIVRALSHGQMRKGPDQLGGKQELASQVIVSDPGAEGGKLRPGDPSYFDTLNGGADALHGGKKGGNDMQEGPGMGVLKQLTTEWLRSRSPALVAAVEASLASVVPAAEIASRAKADIFHFMCENFYDSRMKNLSTVQATAVVEAGMALMDKIASDSKDLEAFILTKGITKSNAWAPRASGF
jgi:hypothetical protein